MTLESSPNTGMAVTMDIGDVKDIHPKNKQEVGRRLALWALAKVYGRDIVYSGPIYKSMAVEGDKIRLQFDHVGGGLIAADGKPLADFTIAGADQKFVPAVADDRRRLDRRPQRQGRPAGGGALRLARRRHAEPGQQGGPARLAVPHRHVEGRDGREVANFSCGGRRTFPVSSGPRYQSCQVCWSKPKFWPVRASSASSTP